MFGCSKQALVATSEKDADEDDRSEESTSECSKQTFVGSSKEYDCESEGSEEDDSEEGGIEKNKGLRIHEGDFGSDDQEKEPVPPLNKRQKKNVVRMNL